MKNTGLLLFGLAAAGGLTYFFLNKNKAGNVIAKTEAFTEKEEREIDYLVYGEGYKLDEAKQKVLNDRTLGSLYFMS